MNIQTTLDALSVIGAEVTAAKKRASDMRKAALEPFLAELAATGLVSYILIRGSTPGFNDGEPCEHSADLFVNIEHFYSNYDELPDCLDEMEDVNAETCAAAGHVYEAPPQEIINAIYAVIFETIEEEKGTDYQVSFTLVDGKFVREDGDYDCGY